MQSIRAGCSVLKQSFFEKNFLGFPVESDKKIVVFYCFKTKPHGLVLFLSEIAIFNAGFFAYYTI